jgi:iron(III) transport system substrate-binding protein
MNWLLYFVVFWVMSILANGSIVNAQPSKTASDVLNPYTTLSPNDRANALVKGAKEEREVAIYTSMRVDELSQLTKKFTERYPFLKVNPSRLSGRRVITRVETEYQAGRYSVDVAGGFANISYSLKEGGLIAPYYSPQRKFFPGSNSEKASYFAPDYISPVVLGYNTNLLKRDEVPKTYADLLDPKWKGKLFLDDEDYDWFVVLMHHFGKQRGTEYMKKLAANGVSMRRGRVLQTQMVIAGERPIGIALHGNSLLDFKEKGAPIDYVILDPYFAKPSEMMLARYAPHPHAAALYLDWVLSEEGQSLMASFGRISARKGIKTQFPDNYYLAGADEIGADLLKSIKDFRRIFGLK